MMISDDNEVEVQPQSFNRWTQGWTGFDLVMLIYDDNYVEPKASLRIFAEADAVTRMLTEEINLQVNFAQ